MSRPAPTLPAGGSAGVLDPERLVFIDETWIKTNMAPLRGWGPKGKRLRGFARTTTGARWDLPRRAALRPAGGPFRLRRTDQRRVLPRLCRAAARTRAGARRHRRHGQSRLPQVGLEPELAVTLRQSRVGCGPIAPRG
ncbi:hypothetical protein MESS2_1680025 [Mesorhizobium metallidurans STM 2683]|uniref:Transposase n=1 Tax=Mesorhizobium metallidurans STM 2683 TaxID=1297569 RepID=M5F235_9HYPH|nr:hypothetical protein MESS2_1680025 [Mesorhizobium metallidurans STM 2683]